MILMFALRMPVAHGPAQQLFPTRSVQTPNILEQIETERPWLGLESSHLRGMEVAGKSLQRAIQGPN